MNKTCSSFALLAALGGAAFTVGCGDETPSKGTLADTGTLSAPLKGSSSLGFEYRLRNAVLTVEGPTAATIDSEDYLDQAVASITLGAGEYTIALADGWSLEREVDGAFVPVEATLTSEALQAFTIVANERSLVTFKFQAGEDAIDVGEGGLGVVLDVDDAPGPEALKPNQWALYQDRICGIRADHSLGCSSGSVPLPDGLWDAVFSGAGATSICGLTYPDHRAQCAGTVQRTVFETGAFESLVVGRYFDRDIACGTRASGELHCWGASEAFLPAPSTFISNEPVINAADICYEREDLFFRHECVRSTPTAAPPYHVSSLVGGHVHTCGLSQAGVAICWGENGNGQLQAPSGAFTQLSAGAEHTCGVKQDGTLACWGNDQDARFAPPSGGDFLDVRAGSDHTCARRASGSFACWGAAPQGAEVSGDFLDVPVPRVMQAAHEGPWSTIVPLRVNQDDYPDLLYYETSTGRAVYTAGTATPGVETVALETSYAAGWTDIYPVSHTEASVLTDLTFYDRVSGNYSATVATGVPGVQTDLYWGPGTPGFSIVVPMSMDADSLTDALWYNPETGNGILSASMGASSEVMLGAGWTAILPVHLNADPDTDLLFYNRATGAVSLSVATGPAAQTHLADGHFGPGFTELIPININGDHFTDVFRYDASSGKAVYTVIFDGGELRDVRTTLELPSLRRFASMPYLRDRSKSFIAALGDGEAP